ncbi:MAG: hypothetical protein RIQ93_3310 [Verrucomicrobiota bacterium]|jgi:hypothetical protein
MPNFVPYFAIVIFVIFGAAFYLALVNFRKMDEEKSEEAKKASPKREP